jgi:uncharacterized membrane protein (DUF4010 family)
MSTFAGQWEGEPLALSRMRGNDCGMAGMQSFAGDFDLAHFEGIALGLAIGLLVGVQRGWVQRGAPSGSRFAGIRTYGLIGMAGGIAGALHANAQGPATVLLAAAAGLILFGYYRATQPGSVSGTASIVGLLTLASGFLTGTGEMILGSAVGVAMVLLLTMRSRLHSWVSRLQEPEVLAIARLALITLVILPLLPDKGYGPYGAWNPRQIWLVVVLVSGFSFLGYFAGKLLGPTRGTIALAATGSIVSSTAVTVALASRLKDSQGQEAALNAGSCVASVVMMLRVLVLVALLAPFALGPLLLHLAPALLASAAPAIWQMRRIASDTDASTEELRLRNPFDIGPALLLAGLVMATTFAARWVMAAYGDAGLAVVLAVSGAVDVDSAIITLGTLPADTIAPRLAAAVLCIPVILNSALKGGLALSIGGWSRGRVMALPLFVSAALIALAVVASQSQ